MKVEIQYPYVVSACDSESKGPEFFAPYHKRFVESFQKFSPGVGHFLKVILCGDDEHQSRTCEARGRYEGIPNHGFDVYEGSGWDIGAHQEVAKKSSSDLVVCLVTPTYFREPDWLVPIVEAFEKFGDGLYGTSASYQNTPHIRTGCFAFSPASIRQYPWMVDSRDSSLLFESGIAPGRLEANRSFTNWMMDQGKPVKMVTRTGCYDFHDWRKPDNIFRRGTQENALAWDRHFDIYAAADPTEKSFLEKLADG